MKQQTPVATLLREQATRGQIEILDAAISEAESRRTPIYIVGGAVRDLLSGGFAGDLDLVTEGDGVKIARGIAANLGARFSAHKRFGTATVSLGDSYVDFASVRQESYSAPAVLPSVGPGTLEQDLARRDFSVNAMAVSLWPNQGTELIDPFNGRSDLDSNTLEVLHPKSFIDDPTRILRAIRLESKSALRLSSQAVDLVRDALQQGVFDLLSGDRLRSEIEQLFDTPSDIRAIVTRLAELCLLPTLSPNLALTSAQMEWFERLAMARTALDSMDFETKPPTWWLIYLFVLTSTLDHAERVALARRLSIQSEQAEFLATGPEKFYKLESELGTPDLPAHGVDEILRESKPEEVVLLLASGNLAVRHWVTKWQQELRSVALAISGEDLLAEGFEPGPWIGRALDAVRNARLDGNIETEAELEFALDHLASRSDRN
jgi:tRNA nucleotidyltransferase (CCA-adding enzyme)